LHNGHSNFMTNQATRHSPWVDGWVQNYASWFLFMVVLIVHIYWLLPNLAITQSGHYPIWPLPNLAITQSGYYTIWLLHNLALTQSGPITQLCEALFL